MLTGDMVVCRVSGKQLVPGLVKTADPRLQDAANAVIDIFLEGRDTRARRGWLSERLKELGAERTDHKLIKGLGKVLLDRCEFETKSPMEPAELRQIVFARAAEQAPLALRAGLTHRRTAWDVLSELAEELDCTVADLQEALYADLRDEQRLTTYKGPSLDGEHAAQGLLARYNVALVQALLLKASRMVVELERPDPKRLRQLFRYVKFFQLMYRVERDGERVIVELDGPESLLRQSTRYGLQLATFLPALLLQTGDWRMEAEVLWGRKRKVRKALSIDSSFGLTSHYRDTGAWRSRTEQWFEERWAEVDTRGWSIGPGELVDLGGQKPLVPDFTFRKDGRVAHLDLIGYWRKGYLSKRLEQTPPHVVLAVSRKLCGDKTALPKTLEARVIDFAEVVPVGKVLDRLEAHAIAE